MGCGTSQPAVDMRPQPSAPLFQSGNSNSNGTGNGNGNGNSARGVSGGSRDKEVASSPTAARRNEGRSSRRQAQERKEAEELPLMKALPPKKPLTKYQETQQRAYACTYHMEVITAEGRLEELAERMESFESLRAAGMEKDLKRLEREVEEEKYKLKKYSDKRAQTGFEQTVTGKNYNTTNQQLLKLQAKLALLEKKR